MNIQSCSTLMEQDKFTPLPSISRTAELQVSPILIVNLVRSGESRNNFKTRTLLDTGSSTSWCHEDLLAQIHIRDGGFASRHSYEPSQLRKRKIDDVFW